MKTYNRTFLLPFDARELDRVENESDFTIIERKVSFNKVTGGYAVYVRFHDVDDNRDPLNVPGTIPDPPPDNPDYSDDEDTAGSRPVTRINF